MARHFAVNIWKIRALAYTPASYENSKGVACSVKFYLHSGSSDGYQHALRVFLLHAKVQRRSADDMVRYLMKKPNSRQEMYTRGVFTVIIRNQTGSTSQEVYFRILTLKMRILTFYRCY